MGGCVATAGRHSLLSLHWLLITGCLLHISSISPLRNYKQHGSAKRDLPSETHCKLRSSAAVGTDDNTPSLTVPRSGTDTVTMILRTVHRSRFAEPRESVSVLPTAALLRSLQWVSDRYVSHRDTAQLILSYSNGGRQWYKVTY